MRARSKRKHLEAFKMCCYQNMFEIIRCNGITDEDTSRKINEFGNFYKNIVWYDHILIHNSLLKVKMEEEDAGPNIYYKFWRTRQREVAENWNIWVNYISSTHIDGINTKIDLISDLTDLFKVDNYSLGVKLIYEKSLIHQLKYKKIIIKISSFWFRIIKNYSKITLHAHC